MPAKRTPRGPKCPVCLAVMSPKDEGGEPVCWHTASHKEILKVRAAGRIAAGDAQRGKPRDTRAATAAAKAARDARKKKS